MNTKHCYRCDKNKNIEEFNNNRTTKDGLQTECRACTSVLFKDWYKNRRKNSKVCSKCNKRKNYELYYVHNGNKDGRFGKCIACCKKYRASNKEREKNRAKEWQINNSMRYKEYQKKYHKENKIKITRHKIEYDRRRRKTDKKYSEGLKLRNSNRNNLKRAIEYYLEGRIDKLPSKSPSKQLMRLYIIQDNKCIYCEKCIKSDKHIEHIIPLSKNGSNDIHNLALSCSSCNLRKKDKDLNVWLEENDICYESFIIMIKDRNEIYY